MWYNVDEGLLHPKIHILSLITYPHVVLNRKSLGRLRNKIKDILDENWEACKLCPCGVADTEERTQFVFIGFSPKLRYGDMEETNGCIKVVIFVFFP